MARRRQRDRRPPPRRRDFTRQDDRFAERALDVAAARLVSEHSTAELRLLVQRSRDARYWADVQAQQEPSPEALQRFRAAERSLLEAERALALSEAAPGDPV